YGWAFLAPYLSQIPVSIFSRHAYVPPILDSGHAVVVPPSIDPFSPKSEPLDAATVRGILEQAGLVQGRRKALPFQFTNEEGAARTIDRQARFVSEAPPPRLEDRLVLQVSRWDPLKDPRGVIDAFARVVAHSENGVHLML